MNDHEWQQAYNAGRREASEGLVEQFAVLLEALLLAAEAGKFGEYAPCDPPEEVAARAALAKYREGL